MQSHFASRRNVYALIHKALRLAMTDALFAVGKLDATDAQEVSDTLVRVRELLAFCEMHLEAENTFVHPAMEARQPGSAAQAEADHVDHRAAIASLTRFAEDLAGAPAEARARAAVALYAELALFVGENFVHMHEEETRHNPVLWQGYSDDELAALESEIKAYHTPAQMQLALRWMLPAMTPAERDGLLAAMRAGAPAPVFAGVVALARAHVDVAVQRKLETALAA